jgi:hypothetical protein
MDNKANETKTVTDTPQTNAPLADEKSDEAREYFDKHGLDPLHVLMNLHKWFMAIRAQLGRWGISA